jgi:hypothetical protein
MKKTALSIKISFIVLAMIIGFNAIGQQLVTEVRELDLNAMTYDPGNSKLGKSTSLTYADVEGTPFWSDKWNPAIIYFANGSKAKINQAKLNLYSDEIYYLNSAGEELVVENEGITRLVFLSKTNLTQPIASFAKLINHITGVGTAFYQVLSPGLYQLILLQKQLVKTSPYDPIQAKTVSSFYTKKNYAIYNEGKISPLRDLDRKSIIGATPNNDFVKMTLLGDKTKLNNEKDVIAYLEMVNFSFAKIGEKK